MEIMDTSQFKAHVLQILDQVARTRQGVVVTKRGRPIAQVIPVSNIEGRPVAGQLADTLIFEKDIVSPLGEEMWKSACEVPS